MASSDSKLAPELLIRIMRNSLFIQNHFQLLVWMQGDFQEAIPHDIMISLSSSLGGETHHYDIVSSTPGIRTAQIPASAINEFRSSLHQHRAGENGGATTASIKNLLPKKLIFNQINEKFYGMKYILFHSIHDTRFNADHLYILLRRSDHFSDAERKDFELLLPHVDSAVRKIEGLPITEPERVAAPILLNSLIRSGLTTREIEILEWVRNGKTNIEIGMILGISSFTVKNHLQRIYRKINVSNRAQAVGKLEKIANGPIACIGNQYGEQLVYGSVA